MSFVLVYPTIGSRLIIRVLLPQSHCIDSAFEFGKKAQPKASRLCAVARFRSCSRDDWGACAIIHHVSSGLRSLQ